MYLRCVVMYLQVLLNRLLATRVSMFLTPDLHLHRLIICLLFYCFSLPASQSCLNYYGAHAEQNHAQKKFLTDLGISESVADRIIQHRPEWINSIKKSLSTSDNDWAPENVVWYRGLSLNSIAEFTPYRTNAGHYSSENQLWMAPDINTSARYGKIMIQYHIRATEILTYSSEGIALDKKFYDDERIFIEKIGVLKDSSSKVNYLAITENDYTWYTFDELVAKKLLRKITPKKRKPHLRAAP